ncbi:hypothetical protein PMZ80_009778 [Knufia obscura]|nr:hypothetical protein PMZ80_009778 [Knufia obscura]
MINDLDRVLYGGDIYGYIFNSSTTPPGIPYQTYNWCNMPHARRQEYTTPPSVYSLKYVEVIHRHHKRTPYASNTFPVETGTWLCNDESLYYYGAPSDNNAAQIAWSITQSPTNPFKPTGFQNSTCQFPQITSEGLLDSRQHGADLFGIYHDLLSFLPSTFDPEKVKFRVTNNVITSQVASQIATGLYPSLAGTRLPVTVQPTDVDSLEPQYPCPASDSSYESYGVGSDDPSWREHLDAPETTQLFAELDRVSGVNTSDSDWHNWFDHYFDNLSAKLCHAKSLPCNINDSALCVTPSMADAVFRRGLYEYSYIYRDSPHSLSASVASYGVYMAELAANIRAVMDGSSEVLYRHNVAHDGSMSRLLSILQVDVMVWPGMGSEIVFELWQKASSGCWFVRVLWKGQPLRSSNPMLGSLDMVPVDALLGYVDGLVGINANKVLGLCSEES